MPRPLASASPAEPPPKPRFSAVDSLRAVACVAVIISHALGVFMKGVGDVEWLVSLVNLGFFGVQVFFIISGYVILDSLRGERISGVKRFMIRRFWRLYPPFWGALVIGYVTNLDRFTIDSLALAATMIPSLVGGAFTYGYFWTLEVELIFYVMLALLFIFMGRMRWRGVIVLGVMTFVLLAFPDWEGYWEGRMRCLALMFFGASCREAMSLGTGKAGRSLALGLITTLASLIYFEEVASDFLDKGYFRIHHSTVVLGAIWGFLFWVILRPVKIQWLANIGRATYSAYLFHGIIVYYILAPFAKYLGVWMWPIYTAVAIILSFAVGAAAYRWIEQPSDRIGKRLTRG